MTPLSDHAASKVRRFHIGGTVIPSAEGPSIHTSQASKHEALELAQTGQKRAQEMHEQSSAKQTG
jgi:hypothetical protein